MSRDEPVLDSSPPSPTLLAELRDVAVNASRRASDIISHSNDRSAIATKSTATDIVTQTDVAAETAIIDSLVAATPGSRIYGEESGQIGRSAGSYDSVEWIVDPLDGTVNFSYGIPITAVSVAASINGEVSVGVVIDGSGAHHFEATKGGGAFLNGKRLAVSGCDDPGAALIATGFAYDAERRRQHAERIARVIAEVRDVRAFGSAALHLCGVASGRLDCYVERHIKPWDWAAGALICSEAGATVEWPCPENDDLMMAATPAVFRAIRAHF